MRMRQSALNVIVVVVVVVSVEWECVADDFDASNARRNSRSVLHARLPAVTKWPFTSVSQNERSAIKLLRNAHFGAVVN